MSDEKKEIAGNEPVLKPELKKILPTLTKDEEDPREDDDWRRDAEIARDRPPHHG
jgi:hypothetical protein